MFGGVTFSLPLDGSVTHRQNGEPGPSEYSISQGRSFKVFFKHVKPSSINTLYLKCIQENMYDTKKFIQFLFNKCYGIQN